MPRRPKSPDAPISANNVTTTVLGGGLIGIAVQVDIAQVLKVLDASTALQTIDQYKQLQPSLAKAIPDLKTYLTRQDSQISSVQNQLTNAQTQITTLQNSNNDLTNQVAALNAQITQLKAQLAAQPQKALPLHVAQSFKNAMDQIQSDARAAGGPQTTITNMQIAVKALISVQDGATPNTKDAVMVFPDPSTPPDPNLLSTLTVNFGAIPNIRAAATATSSSSAGASSSTSSAPSSSSGVTPPGVAIPAAPLQKDAPAKRAAPGASVTSSSSASRVKEKLKNLGRKSSGS